MKKYKLHLICVFALFSLLPNTAFACQCELTIPCHAYNQAEAVFIGKVRKIVTSDEKGAVGTVDIYFEVEKLYKGNVGASKIVKFSYGDCGIKFTEGETYFVYQNRQNEFPFPFCNRTNLLEVLQYDKDYADSLSLATGEFSVYGRIGGLSESETQSTRVCVDSENSNQKLSLNKNGEYAFSTRGKGFLKVKIILPFDTNVYPNNILKTSNTNQTFLEYVLDAKPNYCDFRKIEILRK